MREHLFELSVAELKELYIHETKAMVFALEAGVPWEDLKYIRDSIKDVVRFIDMRSPPSKYALNKNNGEITPPFLLPVHTAKDVGSMNYQQSTK
jgi:hypothetical protein